MLWIPLRPRPQRGENDGVGCSLQSELKGLSPVDEQATRRSNVSLAEVVDVLGVEGIVGLVNVGERGSGGLT